MKTFLLRKSEELFLKKYKILVWSWCVFKLFI